MATTRRAVREPTTAIAKRIEALIRKRGTSRFEIARRIGMYPGTFNRALVENGDRLPISKLPRLAKELGISVAYLITGKESKEAEGVRRELAVHREQLLITANSIQKVLRLTDALPATT